MISFIFKNGRFIEQSLTLLIGVMGTMKVDANRSTLGVTLSRSLADARSSSVVQRAELYVPMTWWLEKATQSLPHNTLIGMDFYRRGRIQRHALSWINSIVASDAAKSRIVPSCVVPFQTRSTVAKA